MATNTTNLNLIKPAGSERVQISQINQNMDILDEKIGAVGNTSLQGQITNLGNRIDTEVSAKQYNLGQLTSDTLANQIYAFANAHRQMNGYTGAFYLSATAVPSDIPAQTNEWKYAHGHFHIRHSNATGVADGEIVLYGFNTNRIAIKNMANNVVTDNWAIINGAYTFSNASDLYSFVTELNSYVSSMVMYDSRNVAIEFTAASSPFTSARYIGTLTKTSDSRAQLTLHQHNAPVIIYGIQNGTTWQWDSYLLNSQATNLSGIAKTSGTFAGVFVGPANQIDANRVYVVLGYPFLLGNTNYTITVNSITLFGINGYTSGITVDSKMTTGCRLVLSRSGTVGQSFVAQVEATISFN